MRTTLQRHLHTKTTPCSPGDTFEASALFIECKQSNDILARDCLYSGIDESVHRVRSIHRCSVEIVAAERVKVDRLKPIDQGVNLITLHRVFCSLKEVVELCDLCAEVVDVAELLESVVC